MSPIRYNCHVHVFTKKYVPWDMLRLPDDSLDKVIMEELEKAFHQYGKYSPDIIHRVRDTVQEYSEKKRPNLLDQISDLTAKVADLAETLHYFLNGSPDGFLDDLFDTYRKEDPSSQWVFCLLTQNFDYAAPGYYQPFYKQLEKTLRLKESFPDQVLVFYGLDPRAHKYSKIDEDWLEKSGVDGFKVYPPLGFYPIELEECGFYKLAEKKHLPITAHCSIPHNVRYQGDAPLHGVNPKNSKKLQYLVSKMTYPLSWKPVLDEHKDLFLNLAHFGDPRKRKWTKIIVEMIDSGEYPNLYADISYCLDGLPRIARLIKQYPILADRLLFGSDYFLQTLASAEATFLNDTLEILGQTIFDKISIDNPRRFLQYRAPVA